MAEENSQSQNQEIDLSKAKMPEEFDLLIVNMDKILYEGKAKSMIAPGPFGNFAILPGHTPLFIKLNNGTLTIDKGNGTEDVQIDAGGIAKITQFKVIVLVGFEEREVPKQAK